MTRHAFNLVTTAVDQRPERTLASLCINARPLHALHARAEPIPTYPPGRECECGTRLSIYNSEPLCAACTPDQRPPH